MENFDTVAELIEIAEKNNITFTEIEYALELVDIFQTMFSVDE